MTQSIRLDAYVPDTADPSRLEPFAGRALGEQQFQALQAYADDRIGALPISTGPGIIDGLTLTFSGGGAAARLRIEAGIGVGADGRLVALALPLAIDWPALIALHRRERERGPADGFYHLTVRRAVEVADADDPRTPCTRTEADPLRDSRIETVARPGLQLLSQHAEWMQMDAIRAGNRLCVHQLRHDPFDPATGAVPLALIKIEGEAPVWIDTRIGRIEATFDGRHRAFLAHTAEVMAAFNAGRLHPVPASGVDGPFLPDAARPTTAGLDIARPLAESRPAADDDLIRAEAAIARRPPSLADRLTLSASLRQGLLRRPQMGIDAAPRNDDTPLDALDPVHNPNLAAAAGPDGPAAEDLSLPARLGLDYLPAAGPFPAGLIDNIGGTEPVLAFDPADLQVELTAAPASVLAATIARELPRGVVDLIHDQQPRIRLLAAVADPDYRPDLMDLPPLDRALVETLYWRARDAFVADADWRGQWQALFNGLDTDGLGRAQAPALPSPPTLADDYMDGLVAGRQAELGGDTAELPEPYRSHAAPALGDLPHPTRPPDDYQAPSFTGSDADGLYRQREDLRARIEELEDELEESFDIMEELNGYLTLQRQQLDALSISFTQLAGGTPGDGSGLNVMRWTNYTAFIPIRANAQDPDPGQ